MTPGRARGLCLLVAVLAGAVSGCSHTVADGRPATWPVTGEPLMPVATGAGDATLPVVTVRAGRGLSVAASCTGVGSTEVKDADGRGLFSVPCAPAGSGQTLATRTFAGWPAGQRALRVVADPAAHWQVQVTTATPAEASTS